MPTGEISPSDKSLAPGRRLLRRLFPSNCAARYAISADDWMPSLALMCSRWDSIVLMLRWRVSTISRVVRPWGRSCRAVFSRLRAGTFVLKTDVRSYHASIDHDLLDERLEMTGLFFVRYMDDIAVLAPTRGLLRAAVKAVTAVLNGLLLEKAPEMTFTGRVERGFDFLGYQLSPGRLALAKATVERFAERALRLYEQDRGQS